MAFVAFQAVFAIITVALISGAIADRAKFGAWMVFAGVWATIVYFPVAHWVFDFDADGHVGGWIANSLKVIDFAGGTAVHINAGAAGLALALVLGKRLGFGREADAPAQPDPGHDRRRPAVVRLVRLQRRVRARGQQHRRRRLGQHDGRHRRRDAGLARGGEVPGRPRDVAGRRLRCGRRPGRDHAVLFGRLADRRDHRGCRRRRGLRPGRRPEVPLRLRRLPRRRRRAPRRRSRRAPSSSASSPPPTHPAGVDGLFYGGGVDQLWRQVVGALAVLVFSFVLTLVIGTVIQKTMGFRLSEEDEVTGIDTVEHAESAYDFSSLGSSGSTAPLAGQARAEARSTEGVRA